MIDATALKKRLIKICEELIANEQYLCELDSFVGDGDHGITVARGFKAAREQLVQTEDVSITNLLKGMGERLTESMGGAIGPIFGSFFTGAAETTEDKTTLTLSDLSQMFREGLDYVMMVGGANPGDRTLVDALAPAVDCLEQDSKDGIALETALENAAKKSQLGALSTKDMVAKKGRAKFLGEKSKGYQDAGATSMAILITALSKS